MFENQGYHWRDNMFWKRLPDGSVRIALFATRFSGAALEGDDDEPVREWVIPPNEWASIVCAVSQEGENGQRWEEAQDFHGRAPR